MQDNLQIVREETLIQNKTKLESNERPLNIWSHTLPLTQGDASAHVGRCDYTLRHLVTQPDAIQERVFNGLSPALDVVTVISKWIDVGVSAALIHGISLLCWLFSFGK